MSERKWQPWPVKESLRSSLARPTIAYEADLSGYPYRIELDLDRVGYMMRAMGFRDEEIRRLGVMVDRQDPGAYGHQRGEGIFLRLGGIINHERGKVGRLPSLAKSLGNRIDYFSEETVLERAGKRASECIAHELQHYYQYSYWVRDDASDARTSTFLLAFTGANTFNALAMDINLQSKLILGLTAFVTSVEYGALMESRFSIIEYNARKIATEMMQDPRWQKNSGS